MTQAQQALLQQLHDIHLPTGLNKWLLAPGWYVVLSIVLALLLGGLFWFWRWYQSGKSKREALRLLTQYEKSNAADPETIAAINELLKRVALVYFPREQVAALYGQEWLKFLHNSSKNLRFLEEGEGLIAGPYQQLTKSRLSSQDMLILLRLVRRWIAQRRKPCLS